MFQKNPQERCELRTADVRRVHVGSGGLSLAEHEDAGDGFHPGGWGHHVGVPDQPQPTGHSLPSFLLSCFLSCFSSFVIINCIITALNNLQAKDGFYFFKWLGEKIKIKRRILFHDI